MTDAGNPRKRNPYMLLWAKIMLDSLFGGNKEARDKWITQNDHLSDEDFETAVEDACNLR